MEQRFEFVLQWAKHETSMAELCRTFGISRQAGYGLVAHFRAEGLDGLKPHSRAPQHHPNAIAEEVCAAVLRAKAAHPSWGPKKLKPLRDEADSILQQWPVAGTRGAILTRAGLTVPRRPARAHVPPRTQPFGSVRQPNDTWCADFKGWFRTGDGVRCDPLTISDADSRFLLTCRIVPPTTEGVQPRFRHAFREFGLPRAMRTDNGPPFASSGAGGLSQLSVEWVKLGIKLERIDPGAPQQNGRHERLHRTLKDQTSRPPAATARAQQKRFDRFREHYSHERPHEALGQETPASHYTASPRRYPDRIEEPWYDCDHAVRRVRTTGEIKWGGEFVFVSEALVGEPVGIAETKDGDWIVRFADIDLGLIDRQAKKLRRFAAPRPGRRKAHRPEQTEKTVTHVSGP